MKGKYAGMKKRLDNEIKNINKIFIQKKIRKYKKDIFPHGNDICH